MTRCVICSVLIQISANDRSSLLYKVCKIQLDFIICAIFSYDIGSQ